MEFVDFVIENYIWFILGGIVILMILIGYFAEKTQFGKKKINKKEKQKKSGKKISSDKQEESIIPNLERQTETVETPKEEIVETPVEQTEEVLVEDMEEPMEDLDAIEIREPDVKEETSATEALLKQIEEEVPEDLYAGLDGTPNAYKMEDEDSASEDLNLDLPDIDALKNDVDDISSEEDDIWRF